jgi:eukaryotic-like serine/threonine-protein kinase
MYNEDLEGFEEAENTPQAYVTKVSQQDAEKLARENERLKKSLEKEKFFNKLLDQELKDTKAEASTRVPADFVPANRGVSKGAFYTVLVLALALAGFLLYNFYNKGASAVNTTPAEPVSIEETTPVQENPVAPAQKDTVPEIIATAPVQPTKPVEEIKKTVIPPSSVNNTVAEEETVQKPVAVTKKPAPVVTETTPATETVIPVPATRPIIATYKVPSKANFYNSPDENTLRSAFINGGNKTVNALEDKNGFIYVEYVNENGMMNRGWLSKKDLTQE